MFRYGTRYTHTIAKIVTIILSIVFLSGSYGFQPYTHAQDQGPLPRASTLFLSPSTETVLLGSTFEVQVFLDTQGNSVNTVELNLKFSQDTLQLVSPSGGTSFISIWLEPPRYSNAEGTASFTGVVPNGITTESGLITAITFKARATGRAIVEVLASSKVLANDGFGTNIASEFGRGVYTINPKPPKGVKVFSDGHPFEGRWDNNNNPVLTWEKELGISDFSFVLDSKPLTVPDNSPDAQDTIQAYEDVADGLWYFHIKARKEGVWGSATHFLLHIDTTPPASFKPKVEVLTAAIIKRAFLSFYTTDSLAGIDHYEVGVIDKTKSPLESPVFVEAQSPYQLPKLVSKDLRVIVRAIDKAGNVRDESVDVDVPLRFMSFIKSNIFVILLILIIAVILVLMITHYLFGHRVLARARRVLRLWKKVEKPSEHDRQNKPD